MGGTFVNVFSSYESFRSFVFGFNFIDELRLNTIHERALIRTPQEFSQYCKVYNARHLFDYNITKIHNNEIRLHEQRLISECIIYSEQAERSTKFLEAYTNLG